ncbi:hypothetical protein O6H91_06G090000 [Diphasiastrum complanatum]|uniref:Uncharacterized protein n=1 Tax=Diphasiastrum complanatum TaxID=34168 RepID=A0ACC2DFZ9_DIPCM|nr:hypothetical protein O6H91_06G090000 [Diphasiastrum complanatum]
MAQAGRVLDGVQDEGRVYIEDEAWIPSDFVHEPPVLNVTQPKGAFCQIEARFSVVLNPDGVYDIITDPNNRRVFKNIKEVTFRKVLEDDGNRQLVEVEQEARWRFLIFSGSFPCRVLVEQNREKHSMTFDLLKKGMMNQFSGSWKIEPMYLSEASSKVASEPVNSSKASDPVIGSWLQLHQVLEPSFIPPWPLTSYVRSVSVKIVREICGDLQRECLRLKQNHSEEQGPN